MRLIDENAIPGGVAMTILADQISKGILQRMMRKTMSRHEGGLLGILGGLLAGAEESGGGLAAVSSEAHDCDHCDAYDACPLPIKKPRDAPPR